MTGMTMTRPSRLSRLTTAAVASIAAISLGACSSSKAGTKTDAPTSSAPTGPTVSLKLLQFKPADLTIKVGTTVTWVDDEPITHTVTSGAVSGIDPTTGLRSSQTPDGKFDHRLTGKGSTFSYTFSTPGTYSYFCSIHDGMNAKVTVTN